MAELQVVFPATDENALTEMLRKITEAIEVSQYGGPDGFGLGGAFGYGAHWDSDVFQMRRYCWCDRGDCPWCAGCDCPPVHACALHAEPSAEWTALGFEPELGAPQFWHKPSGLKVWWYKYIGRGMEVYGEADLAVVVEECLTDIARLSTPEGEG